MILPTADTKCKFKVTKGFCQHYNKCFATIYCNETVTYWQSRVTNLFHSNQRIILALLLPKPKMIDFA